MTRHVPLDLDPEEFRRLGHRLVDAVGDLLGSMRDRKVTPGETPDVVRSELGAGRGLPPSGTDAGPLLDAATRLLADHSLFNGHPRFFGYITSSPAPIGVLAELLAAAVNPNVGAFLLSPVATEIERQTVRWIAELIGYPADSGGLLVTGGTMANVVGLLAARRARAGWDVRKEGLRAGPPMRVYASSECHTWLQKTADLFGLGSGSVRFLPTDRDLRLDVASLDAAIRADLRAGDVPLAVIASAGTVATGAIDPIREIAAVCRTHGAWLHVDGAYGALAAALPDAGDDLHALALADSVAVDPHKWLYAPLDAGCALVRNAAALPETFAYHPSYYQFDGDDAVNYYELGIENSRSFRALKVWLALQHAGRDGYVRMIGDDVALARALHEAVGRENDLEARTLGLSISTFRYAPPARRGPEHREALNALNAELLARLQRGGEAFVSNAVVDGDFVLRACIVNFRTTLADVEALPALVARLGREVDQG